MTLRDQLRTTPIAQRERLGLAQGQADAALESRITCEDALRGVLSVLADGLPLEDLVPTMQAIGGWTQPEIAAAVNRVGLLLVDGGRVVLDRRRHA